MATKVVKDLKAGDKLLIEGTEATLDKIEFSQIGKHGRSKVRLECTLASGEKKVIIRVADATVDVPE